MVFPSSLAEAVAAADEQPDVVVLAGGTDVMVEVNERHRVVRGIGYGVSIKNLMYSEGFDDYSTARCRLHSGFATHKFATGVSVHPHG